MNSYSIYANREDAQKLADEERNSFVRDFLEGAGLPMDKIWPQQNLQTTEEKIEFRKAIDKFNIQIIFEIDGSAQIYGKDDQNKPTLIAEWFKPIYILRKDDSIVDPAKKLFFEITFKYKTLWDE